MADMMDLSPKAAQKLWSKGGDCNKLYVNKVRATSFWFFYKEANGRNYTILKKVSNLIEDNTKALEETNGVSIAQHIKDNNIGVQMKDKI